MKKIECRKCRFYKGRDVKELLFPLTGYTQGCEIIIDCVIPKNSGFANSRLKNEKNDCPDFKRFQWWRR